MYAGDWRNDEREGKGYLSYYNGGREMRNFTKSKKIGTFAQLTRKDKYSTKFIFQTGI